MKGYTAFGATYAPFREALIATLEELQLSYEEPFFDKKAYLPSLQKTHKVDIC